MPAEAARAAQQARPLTLDEGEADVARHRLRESLAVQGVEARLGVEQVDLTGSAFEVDANAGRGRWGEVRPESGGFGGEGTVVLQERRQGQQADAAGAGREEVTA